MADDSEKLDQDGVEQELAASQEGGAMEQAEIDSLLGEDGDGVSSAEVAQQPASEDLVGQEDIELLLNQAEEALESIDPSQASAVGDTPPGIKSFEFKPFSGTPANKEAATLELMRDVQLDMTIELGRTHMQLEDVLKLKQGSVVTLDKLAGDPADIFVNGRLVARGEVLVLNDNFCIRVAELIVGENACP